MPTGSRSRQPVRVRQGESTKNRPGNQKAEQGRHPEAGAKSELHAEAFDVLDAIDLRGVQDLIWVVPKEVLEIQIISGNDYRNVGDGQSPKGVSIQVNQPKSFG